MAVVAEWTAVVGVVAAVLGLAGLLAALLAMRLALKQEDDQVSAVVSADSHRCYHMLAVLRSGRLSEGLGRSVFSVIVGRQDSRAGQRAAAVAGIVVERTSAMIVCLCPHYCMCESGIRGLV